MSIAPDGMHRTEAKHTSSQPPRRAHSPPARIGSTRCSHLPSHEQAQGNPKRDLLHARKRGRRQLGPGERKLWRGASWRAGGVQDRLRAARPTRDGWMRKAVVRRSPDVRDVQTGVAIASHLMAKAPRPGRYPRRQSHTSREPGCRGWPTWHRSRRRRGPRGRHRPRRRRSRAG
jgi:hypothetical protein